jgi:hypothetical protein
MGKMPKPPDPWETASAQSQADMFKGAWDFTNKNISEFTPYGSKQYEKSGTNRVYDPFTKQYVDVPTYSSTVTLSPGEQAILDKNTAMRSNIGDIGVQQSAFLKDHLGRPINTEGLQAWNAGPQAPGLKTSFGDAGPIQKQIKGEGIRQDQAPTDRQAVERAMLDRWETDARRENMAQAATMAARGMSPGGQGYSDMQDAQARARTDAGNQAFLASGEESRKAQDAYNTAATQRFGQGAAQGAFANQSQAQQFQQLMQSAGFSNEAMLAMFQAAGQQADRGNALRQSQWGERQQEYNHPINTIMALLGGTQVNNPQMAAYQAPSTNGVPIGQMIYDNYNARSEQAANSLAGIAGIGSAVAGALPWASWLSDRRAKTDIMPIGASLAGVPLYTFRYWTDMGTTHVGVMADEAKQVHPDAVHMNGADGYDYVDYAMLRRRH